MPTAQAIHVEMRSKKKKKKRKPAGGTAVQ
jgi:hypothetical protein